MSPLISTLRATSLLLAATQSQANTLVDAIAEVESGYNHQAVGDGKAARGAWQLHKGAWSDAGKRLGERWHFSYAHDKGIARRHAEAYVAILCEGLERHLGRKPTNQEVYAAYRLGLEGFKRFGSYARIPKGVRESCERLNNLVTR